MYKRPPTTNSSPNGAPSDSAGGDGKTGPDRPWKPRLALLVAATFFMEFLDATILTTAIPSIAADFRVDAVDVNITMTVYLLAVGSGIPVSGWLAERYSPRRIFILAIAIFTAASLLCAMSPNLAFLALSRIVQGLGGAMMVPVGTLMVLRDTPKSQLLVATAFLAWPGLLAPVLAPVAGGVISTYLSWHWIFLINLPLGIGAVIAALRLTPKTPAIQSHRLDWQGLVLTTAGVGALIAGLELASSHPETPWAGVSAIIGSALLVTAVLWMRASPNPLFDLKVFHSRTFRATATGGFIYRLTISSIPFLLPLMFQTGFGWSPVQAGVMVTAVFIGNICIKPATTPLIRRFGFKTVLVFSALASACTFAGFAFLTPSTPAPLTFALLLCSGAFRSAGFSAYASLQYADTKAAQLTSAATVSATLVQLATGVGIAVGALLIRFFAPNSTEAADAAAPYRAALLVMAALMVTSALDSVLLPKRPGAALVGTGANDGPPD
ncbi:MFS transporter [Paenarthrobacter sp. NPDC089714]|uniref:MFS transporter n=1 Tax=Paenarthrobacter sp. NPDC089714 TaxID=3364377 RepID=UPI0037F796EA